MEDMESSSIAALSVGKARKKNGYYTCPIYSKKDKRPFYVCIKGATIMAIKEVGNSLVLKCKSVLPYLDELTSSLLEAVELNHSEWFNSSIDEAFLEEYFTTPIHYDKRHGIVIRLKIKNLDDIEEHSLHKKVNATFVLKNITFLRQKFYPVFEIHSITCIDGDGYIDLHDGDDADADDVDDVDHEEEDVHPSFDEVLAIKHEKLQSMINLASKVDDNIKDLTKKLSMLKQYISNLENCNSIESILKCCEETIDDSCC